MAVYPYPHFECKRCIPGIGLFVNTSCWGIDIVIGVMAFHFGLRKYNRLTSTQIKNLKLFNEKLKALKK